jgi:hypothetical protein
VLQRLTEPAPTDEGPDALEFGLPQRLLELKVELHALEPERLPHEVLGVEPGILDSTGLEEVGRTLDDFE